MSNQKGVLARSVKGLLGRNSQEMSAIETNLMAVSGVAEIKTILITSCSAKEGKTVSAISIASALAAKPDARAVLVDGNPQAMLHKLFGVPAQPGFSDMVLAGADLAQTAQRTEFDKLSVIPFGLEPARKLDVFDADKFKTALLALRQSFDNVIFDGPSMFDSPAISMMARHFDGVIFVLECEKTRWEVLQEAVKKVRSVGGKILGTVMNKRKFYVPRWFYGS